MQRGFVPILILIGLLISGAIAVGVFYLKQTKSPEVNLKPLPTPLTIPIEEETKNWKTYTNNIHSFSFKHPGPQDNYYYSFVDTSNFMLSTDRRIIGGPTGTPRLSITWENKRFLTEDDYINAEIDKRIGCKTSNECSKSGVTQFGPHTFHAYGVTGVPDSEGFVMKVADSNLFIDVYDVNFPNNIRDAIVESLIFISEKPTAPLLYKNQYFEFSYPPGWALSEGFWPDHHVSVASEYSSFSVSINELSSNDEVNFQQASDELNYYKFNSTAWYGEGKLGQIGKSQIKVSEQEGYKYQWKLAEPYGQATWIYIPYGQRQFTILMVGKNLQTLNQILSTFKFIPP